MCSGLTRGGEEGEKFLFGVCLNGAHHPLTITLLGVETSSHSTMTENKGMDKAVERGKGRNERKVNCQSCRKAKKSANANEALMPHLMSDALQVELHPLQ